MAKIVQKNYKQVEKPVKTEEKAEEIPIKEEELNPELIKMLDWCTLLGNRMSACELEIQWVCGWYEMIYPGDSIRHNLQCPGCVASAIRNLQSYTKKNFHKVDNQWVKN